MLPPPRIHRHRYFGVLAPNSPLRTAVTALALAATTAPPAAARTRRAICIGVGYSKSRLASGYGIVSV